VTSVTKGGTQKLPKKYNIVETYWHDHSLESSWGALYFFSSFQGSPHAFLTGTRPVVPWPPGVPRLKARAKNIFYYMTIESHLIHPVTGVETRPPFCTVVHFVYGTFWWILTQLEKLATNIHG
jgi:hypothetical protein